MMSASDGQGDFLGCSWWFMIFLVICAILGVLYLLDFVHVDRGDDREAEVKSNLHNIQLTVERYAVDHEGQYPAYLIGGQGKYSKLDEYGAGSFQDVADCFDRDMLSDPLLREGYIDAYPKNPFAVNGPFIHKFQCDRSDPLRNGTKEAAIHGTRFGPYCTLMGNVMADVRFTKFTITDAKGIEHTYPTFADVDYPCSDMWRSAKPTPYLPGGFFYCVLPEKVAANGVVREEINIYMLGGYGSIRTKGKDVIGPDPWGVNRVSPYAPDKQGLPGYGNPNGIRDGVILVLVPAEDETK